MDDCAICIEGLESDMKIQKLECGHIFHKECFKQMVIHQIDNSKDICCPLCRREIIVKLTKKQKLKKKFTKFKRGLKVMRPFLVFLVVCGTVMIISVLL